MDVDATYQIMTDESNTLDERAVAATDLLVWLAKGGFTCAVARINPEITADIIDVARHRIFKALDGLEGT
jgi:hypothetical protein